MKNTLLLFAIVSGSLVTSMNAATKAGYQPATVVSVENHATPPNTDGGNPSDAPLQLVVNSHDIGIRLGGTVYRTSYDSAFENLPSAFTPNQQVQVNLKKHVMYLELPGDDAVEMAIESRSEAEGESGMAGN
jgi:hypothetical protein